MSQQQNDNVAIEDKALDTESVIDLLGEDDGKEPETETLELEKPSKESKEAKPDGKKETPKGEEEELSLEDKLELELEEVVDEDKLELVDLPSRREILTAYPDLFKKFPAIEKSMYREKAYSELLPTIQDAKIAIEKADLFDKYDSEIIDGSTESFLSAVKESDKEAFAKLVDNYMPNLLKADPNAYYHTIGNLIKHTIISMVNDAKEQNSEELAEAAAILNRYIFGTDKFTRPTNLSQSDITDNSGKKDQEIDQREQAATQREFDNAREDLGGRVDNILKSSVDKAIDPNASMSGYVKDIATDKVLKGLEDLIGRDVRFRTIYDKLWERAFKDDFDKESMDKIKKAYLSKAQTLLPLLIKKERNEALKGTRRSEDTHERDRKGPLPVGKTRSSTTLASGKSNSSNGNKSVPKGMSTLDYLNSDD